MGEKAVITNQAKVLIGDMLDKAVDKGHGVEGGGVMTTAGVIEEIKLDGAPVVML